MSRHIITKHVLVLALLVATIYAAGAGPSREDDRAQRPLVGVIRWDSWYEGTPYQQFLEPVRWHDRLPYYAEVTPDGVLKMNNETQEIMDQQIRYASQAGIDYWTFNYRGWPREPKEPFVWGRCEQYKLLLSSEHRADINFCLMLQHGHLGPARDWLIKNNQEFDYEKEWDITVSELIELFGEPTYQKVLGDRPLLYFFAADHFDEYFGSWEATREGLEHLRRRTKQAGLAEPYLVAMGWLGHQRGTYLNRAGFDALGGYSAPILPGRDPKKDLVESPYSDLVKANTAFRDACKSADRQTIPVVNSGWDDRPMQVSDNELFHGHDYSRPQRGWYATPSPEEIAGNLEQCFAWMKDNSEHTEANSLLIYAWNEFGEGGWLCPTLSEGNARLNAIERVIRRADADFVMEA